MATILHRSKGERFTDNNGEPLIGGSLAYHEAGTTTLQTTFSDPAGTVPNANPIPLDAYGRLPVPVYIGDGADYKETLRSASNVIIPPWPWDGIPAAVPAATTAAFAGTKLTVTQVTVAQSPVALTVADLGKLYEADTSGGNVEFDLPAANLCTDLGFTFKKTVAANAMLIDGNAAQTIDDISASLSIVEKDAAISIVSNGAEWYVWAGHGLVYPLNSLSEDTTPDRAADFLLTWDASALTGKKVRPNNLITPGALIAVIEDRKAQGTGGGTFTTGDDRVRTLNTLSYNRNTLVALAGGTTGTDGTATQFTLPAGTWEIAWSVPAYNCDQHQSMLYDVTAAAIIARGTSEFGDQAAEDPMQTRSSGHHFVTIGAANTYEIRHRCQLTQATNGLGFATNFTGTTEVYSRVAIRAG